MEDIYQFKNDGSLYKIDPLSFRDVAEHRFCQQCGKASEISLEDDGFSPYTGNERLVITATCTNCGYGVQLSNVYKKDGVVYVGDFFDLDNGFERWYKKFGRR